MIGWFQNTTSAYRVPALKERALAAPALDLGKPYEKGTWAASTRSSDTVGLGTVVARENNGVPRGFQVVEPHRVDGQPTFVGGEFDKTGKPYVENFVAAQISDAGDYRTQVTSTRAGEIAAAGYWYLWTSRQTIINAGVVDMATVGNDVLDSARTFAAVNVADVSTRVEKLNPGTPQEVSITRNSERGLVAIAPRVDDGKQSPLVVSSAIDAIAGIVLVNRVSLYELSQATVSSDPITQHSRLAQEIGVPDDVPGIRFTAVRVAAAGDNSGVATVVTQGEYGGRLRTFNTAGTVGELPALVEVAPPTGFDNARGIDVQTVAGGVRTVVGFNSTDSNVPPQLGINLRSSDGVTTSLRLSLPEDQSGNKIELVGNTVSDPLASQRSVVLVTDAAGNRSALITNIQMDGNGNPQLVVEATLPIANTGQGAVEALTLAPGGDDREAGAAVTVKFQALVDGTTAFRFTPDQLKVNLPLILRGGVGTTAQDAPLMTELPQPVGDFTTVQVRTADEQYRHERKMVDIAQGAVLS
ncbi:MAG: hypothetical protein WCP97_07925 [bacterium]